MIPQAGAFNPAAMFKLSYGLFVLTAKDGDKDNGCIINTAAQLTDKPARISVTVNKANFTCQMIAKTGEFNVSVLTESAPFAVFERFGFHGGKDTDKFAGCGYSDRAGNGIRYVPEHVNGVISAKVRETVDCGTHTLFIADVTGAVVLSDEASVTYRYYFDNIKPKPKAPAEQGKEKAFVCRICGYVHKGDLPEGFICPICKHGAGDFEPL
jgi:flavin reductase (DIM6/NTAB) family NADH-FMN oxidoreductase RutF/rubredoxin